MKLKWQIGTIGLLSLSFPILMWLTLSRLNHSYQENLLTAGQQQAQLIANSIEQFSTEQDRHLSGLIAQPIETPVQLNGLSDEWQTVPTYDVGKNLQFRFGQSKQHLYLWVSVIDSSHEPMNQTNINQQKDRLTIAYGNAHGTTVKHINRQPEGTVSDHRILPLKAYWHETASGYTVEIQLPQTQLTGLGIVATNHTVEIEHYGHYANNNIQLQAVFNSDLQWQQKLSKITPDNSRLLITDQQQRVFYDINKITEQPKNDDWLTNVLYPLIFAVNNPSVSHNLDHQVVNQDFSTGQISLTLAHPPAHRSLIRTFIQTIGWLFGIALLLLLVFLAYAALLAWRIRRLSRQLRHVLDDSGTIHKQLPFMKAADEVGDLSRDLHQLLAQIDQYTDYLKQLGSRLSHEMKTPIGIIQSSLDNVSSSQLSREQQDFVRRAAKANHRLMFILNQLSSLSRLQQAINDNERHPFDLNALLDDLIPAYQKPNHVIRFQRAQQAVFINGNADLMAQLIDKVIENAYDFSVEQQPILVQLNIDTSNQTYQLHISNQGPTLSHEKLSTVFDSLHSYRQQQSQTAHLGIGLYVAKLIARFHHAEITIKNQYQPDGVVVILSGNYQIGI
ncbi:ATP-binding protein [Marinicella gelatinilytica]|uniref:ATP-binding protein n=1 Tax=Marinicella gelatinilytica TaxID=2996017 RepID=UPI002260929D|nr:ATP-binding protein [Marinicella gelatinilytica]MCX7545067.1 ATP-binding protein [Marinicella gelatinilytica]